MQTEYQTKFLKLLFFAIILTGFFVQAQTTVPFTKRYETTGINGDLTIIGNMILGESVDTPYNGVGQNNTIDMVFIDIDNDDSTFNSSSANFSTSSCNRIVYAGLYWGAVLSPEDLEPTKVKFKIPGNSYLEIEADEQLDWIYYKDVTDIVTSGGNVSGDYYVANVSTSQGFNSSAGWSMVIVYEDPNESRKYISTFDGFSAVSQSPNDVVDFNYSGFTTPPSGPVEGRVGIVALEGDQTRLGDQLLFKADGNNNFTALYDDENEVNNFFNGKITKDGAQVLDRNLNSTNTLGWDQKLLNLSDINQNNSLIGNNETGATVRVSSNDGTDWIYSFLNTFAINIIEPNLRVLTSVEDTSNNQITHQSPVPLGSTVWYNIDFRNIGTDNAQNTYILNSLPINVTLDENSMDLPAGVSYTFNEATRELRFEIDDSLVERKSLSTNHSIRYQVTASNECFDYSDACTNLLENSIISYYDGETSGQNISGQPGLNGINGCGLGSVGSMDLFVDTSSCSFDSELFFCNNSLTFSGDDGYDTYIWTDENGNTIGNTKEITVTGAGVYTATQRRTGCTETIRVVTVLGLDVELTPSDALCKDSGNGTVEIKINDVSDSYTFELLQNGSVINSIVKTNDSHIFNNLDIGNYQVRSTNADGCFDVSEFSISEPTLLTSASTKLYNIAICNGEIMNGSLETSASGGTPPYQYSIDGGANYQDETQFFVSTEQVYQITTRDANGCTSISSVEVGFDQEIEYTISQEDVICVGEKDGRISINLGNDQGYEVSYSMDGTNFRTNPDFTGLEKGIYDIWIKKENEFISCVSQKSIELEQLIYLELKAETDFSCQGASNIIIASVDPIYEDEVSYTLDGSLTQDSGIFENVSKGKHTVTVSHKEYGCTDAPIEVVIEEYTPITFNVVPIDINVYEVVANGGIPDYEYSIDADDDFSSTNTLNLNEIRESRDYKFYVKDQRGCIIEKTVYLEFLDIEIPDFFTPQGDGINDTWYPINIEIYPKITVKIFDRYQRLIASYEGNTSSWDGNYKSKPLPSGDYWYVVRLNESSDNREFKGNFSLVR
ncbi:T9SS type B sorting domain-containing protein [Lutimonas zeaxanthinifaciens]|uniref:T9SS type B sorting domain-containing protein n=1 Tax=Lutimonas zeaxanthinifaciens TaxID=3060215 RepID=UPI00265CA058|nr:T9SS type B sorting domain-containing protein [Lutimonas sp. YSD2104]WKK67436.1 T9SS type B sorting domain-containing protein [Lutimonas sp. YSD2104]